MKGESIREIVVSGGRFEPAHVGAVAQFSLSVAANHLEPLTHGKDPSLLRIAEERVYVRNKHHPVERGREIVSNSVEEHGKLFQVLIRFVRIGYFYIEGGHEGDHSGMLRQGPLVTGEAGEVIICLV